MDEPNEGIEDLKDMVTALRQGWSVDKVILYDEEAIEGWQWTDPQGREYHSIGDHNQVPTWTEGAARALGRRPELAEKARKTSDFAEFLNSLLIEKGA